MSLLLNTFLGGYSLGFELPAAAAFALKALALLGLLSAASVLYARLRIDQLAHLGWRVLVPLALLQLVFAIW
jgi:NADH-quinone oxidoreductase subunit H